MVCAKMRHRLYPDEPSSAGGFQLVIARFRQLGSLVAIGGGVDQRAERLLQRGIGRVTYQAMIRHTVPRAGRRLIVADDGPDQSADTGERHSAHRARDGRPHCAGHGGPSVDSQKRRVGHRVAGFSRYRSNLTVIEGKGEQQSRRPQAEDGQQTARQAPLPCHSHVMPA